jgi:hypothetical protein
MPEIGKNDEAADQKQEYTNNRVFVKMFSLVYTLQDNERSCQVMREFFQSFIFPFSRN